MHSVARLWRRGQSETTGAWFLVGVRGVGRCALFVILDQARFQARDDRGSSEKLLSALLTLSLRHILRWIPGRARFAHAAEDDGSKGLFTPLSPLAFPAGVMPVRWPHQGTSKWSRPARRRRVASAKKESNHAGRDHVPSGSCKISPDAIPGLRNVAQRRCSPGNARWQMGIDCATQQVSSRGLSPGPIHQRALAFVARWVPAINAGMRVVG